MEMKMCIVATSAARADVRRNMSRHLGTTPRFKQAQEKQSELQERIQTVPPWIFPERTIGGILVHDGTCAWDLSSWKARDSRQSVRW